MSENEAQKTPQATFLVADIGGTHNRWQRLRLDGAHLHVDTTWIGRNDDAATFHEAWQRALTALPVTEPLSQVVIAAAGPVHDATITLTNRPTWRIDAATLSRVLGAPVTLLNDFAAQAYGLLTVTDAECERLGNPSELAATAPIAPETSAASAPRSPQATVPQPGERPLAVIGPGTGLGIAFLWQPARTPAPLVLSTEAGNLRLPLLPELATHWPAIAADAPAQQPYWEWLLSGPGLMRLHQFLNGATLAPEAIVAAAHADPESAAAHTVTLFSRLLAHFATEATLMAWATQGVVLVGSLANAIAPWLRRREWHDAFLSGPRYRDALAATPLWLVHASDLGLRGAAYVAFRQARAAR